MLQVLNLHKTYGTQLLFDGISFTLGDGERLGLVGRNGSGKSTLFRLILGEETPDEGEIVLSKGYTIGHLAQHLNFSESTVLHEACQGLPPEDRAEEYRAEIILSGLGFSEADMQLAPELLSGGFQIRINLAKVLLSEPHLLLLDEPTNYLDIVSARWLIRFLRSWKNELIIISHDRDFMDSVTTHTMLIHRQQVRKMPGDTKKLYAQVKLDEEIYEKTRINEDKKRAEIETFINRFRAKASKATLVQSKVKALERMGVKEELRDEQSLDFVFREAPFQGKFLLEARSISFGYPSSSKDKAPLLIEDFQLTIRPHDRIGVIGKNGKGKSTLLKLLAGELAPSSGSISSSSYLKLGYFGQTNVSRLNTALSVEEEIASSNSSLSRTGIRSICGTMMFDGNKALKKISVLSGGEKGRVLLGKLIAQPTNLLLLDEPSNHLDMESVEALTQSLKDYEGAVIIVTHSELILRELVTRLVVFQDSGPECFDGDYDYFLQKVGWLDETEGSPTKSSDRPSSTYNRSVSERKAQEPAIVGKREKAKILKPIEKEIEVIEKQIRKLEQEVEQANREIIEASKASDSNRIALLGKNIKEAQKLLDQHFRKLEELMDRHTEVEEQFKV